MLTPFHAPRTRSGSIVWLLEELGVPYETQFIDIRRGDGSGARRYQPGLAWRTDLSSRTPTLICGTDAPP